MKRWVAANRTTAGWHEGWGRAAARDTAASLLVVPLGGGVGEREYEDVGISTYKLRVQVC